jgi:3-oxoacyl-[acyl-carrier protein] reductase
MTYSRKRLKGKICVITGSSRGIGAAIAQAFSNEGAKVVITYLNQADSAAAVARKCHTKLIYQLDVRNRENIVNVFNSVASTQGRIDVLVNNAGVNKTNDFDKLTERDWDLVLDVDLKGVFFCCQEVLRFMPDGGRIVNIGSLSGEYGGPRTPSYGAFRRPEKDLCKLLVPRSRRQRFHCLHHESRCKEAGGLTAFDTTYSHI